MAELVAHGLTVDTPAGWEGRVFRRAEHGQVNVEVAGAAAPLGERSFPVVHVATIALPLDMADYGSDVVEDLGRDDALVVLKEFDPADATQPLFEREGMPRPLRPAQFSKTVLQRRLDGQSGYQEFFQEGGRAFCLYVVLGDHDRRSAVVPKVNSVLASLVIDPLLEPEETEPTTTTSSTLPEAPTTTSTAPAEEPVTSTTGPPMDLPPEPDPPPETAP